VGTESADALAEPKADCGVVLGWDRDVERG
jgi:hypothetical protein